MDTIKVPLTLSQALNIVPYETQTLLWNLKNSLVNQYKIQDKDIKWELSWKNLPRQTFEEFVNGNEASQIIASHVVLNARYLRHNKSIKVPEDIVKYVQLNKFGFDPDALIGKDAV